MNREQAKRLNAAITAAVKALETEHGIAMGRLSSTYSTTGMRIRIEVEDAAPEAVAIRDSGSAEIARILGLNKPIGATFVRGSRAYRITGIREQRWKRPICATRVADGKKFIFPVETVNAAQLDRATTTPVQ